MSTIERAVFRVATPEEIKEAQGGLLWQIGSFPWKTLNKILGTLQVLNKRTNLLGWEAPFTQSLAHRVSRWMGWSPDQPLSSKLPSFFGTWHFIDHYPEVARALFALHRSDGLFSPSRGMAMFKKILEDTFPEEKFTDEDSMLACNRENTTKYRTMILDLLKSENYNPIVEEQTKAAIASWREKGEINVTQETRALASNILTSLFLGEHASSEKLGQAINFINSYIVRSVLRKVKSGDLETLTEALKTFKEAVNGILESEREIPIFQGLDQPLSPAAKKSMIFTLFFAGQETIAALMTYALWQFAKYRKKPELDTDEKVHQFFVGMIHDHPSAHGVGRMLKENACLEVTFLKGEESVTHKTIMWKGESIGARIINLAAGMKKEGLEHKSFMPFGSGPHKCPGEKLAIKEFKELISTLTAECNLSLIEPVENPLLGTFTLQLEKEVWISITPKH